MYKMYPYFTVFWEWIYVHENVTYGPSQRWHFSPFADLTMTDEVTPLHPWGVQIMILCLTMQSTENMPDHPQEEGIHRGECPLHHLQVRAIPFEILRGGRTGDKK